MSTASPLLAWMNEQRRLRRQLHLDHDARKLEAECERYRGFIVHQRGESWFGRKLTTTARVVVRGASPEEVRMKIDALALAGMEAGRC